ncbi:MAG: hypothetical protein RI918_863, partial [Pseudomonadota bacterium]
MYLVSLHGQVHSVHARHKITVCANDVVHRFTHAGHDFLVYRHVRAVGQLNADVRNRAAQRAHGERHDVHGAASHAAVEQRVQRGAHFFRSHPVVGRAGVFFFFRANVSAVFHAGDVAGARV